MFFKVGLQIRESENFEEALEQPVIVPEHYDVMGAWEQVFWLIKPFKADNKQNSGVFMLSVESSLLNRFHVTDVPINVK